MVELSTNRRVPVMFPPAAAGSKNSIAGRRLGLGVFVCDRC
jgi:hypothetical protein